MVYKIYSFCLLSLLNFRFFRLSLDCVKKKITITDIANIAGVSKTTISFYLNGKQDKMSEKTRNDIAMAIEKTGYKPSAAARSLNSKRSHLLGVIVGDMANEFANQVIRGIEDTANTKSYLAIIASSSFNPEKEKELVLSMVAMGVDGFIVQPSSNFEGTWKSLNIDLPIVYFDSPSSKDDQMYVKTDNYEVVYKTTDALVKKGYKHFVIVTKNPYNVQTRMDRNKGCIDALDKYKIEHDVVVINSQTSAEMLKKKLLPLVKQKDTCVFALKPSILRMCYSILKPEINTTSKIGLIGFDYNEWCDLVSPSVTTIRQPAYKEGAAACKIIFSVVYGTNDEKKQQIINSTFVERDSTKR